MAFHDVKGSNLKLFPTVGLKKTGEHIRVNFGQTPFVYDIDGMMKVCISLSSRALLICEGRNHMNHIIRDIDTAMQREMREIYKQISKTRYVSRLERPS